MPGTQPGFVARFAELLDREGTNRCQHAEPGLPVDIVFEPDQQRLVVDRLEQLVDLSLAGRAERACRVERERVDEDAKLSQEPPFVGGQQVVAPVDCGAQRLMSPGDIGGAAGKNRKLPCQGSLQRGERKHPQPGGSQLDCQWQPVQIRADGLDDGDVAFVRANRLAGAVRPIQKQVAGNRQPALIRSLLAGSQRVDRNDQLARDVQGRAAGCEHPQARQRPQQRGNVDSGREEVLHVVEHRQYRPPASASEICSPTG